MLKMVEKGFQDYLLPSTLTFAGFPKFPLAFMNPTLFVAVIVYFAVSTQSCITILLLYTMALSPVGSLPRSIILITCTSCFLNPTDFPAETPPNPSYLACTIIKLHTTRFSVLFFHCPSDIPQIKYHITIYARTQPQTATSGLLPIIEPAVMITR